MPNAVQKIVAIAVLLCFASAGAALRTSAAPEPFVIYAISALTGQGAYQGKMTSSGYKLYADSINKSGGIHGQPIQIEVLDDESNPRVAVQLANGIMAKHPAVILGPTIQATCNAVGALAVAGPVVYCQSPGLSPPKDSFVFSSGVAITHTVPIAVRFARLNGTRRMALLIANDATGARTEQLLNETLALPENHSIEVVAREHFENSALGITAQLSQIKSANPDWIYVSASGSPFQTILRGMRDLGLKTPLTTSTANMHEEFITPYISGLPDALYFNGPIYWGLDLQHAGALRPALAEYFAAHRDAGTPVTAEDAYGWDSGKLIIDALRKLGPGATADQLRRYLEGLHGVYGIYGQYDFRRGDQHGLSEDSSIMLKFDPEHRTFVVASGPAGALLKTPKP
jgi:branched-chain amino acid transport system substrate-binding protein